MIPFTPVTPPVAFWQCWTSPVEPRYCTCTGDNIVADWYGMCVDCLRLIDPEPTA